MTNMGGFPINRVPYWQTKEAGYFDDTPPKFHDRPLNWTPRIEVGPPPISIKAICKLDMSGNGHNTTKPVSAAAKYLRMQYNERCLGMDNDEYLGMDMSDGEEPSCDRPINVDEPKPELFESGRMQSRCVRGALNVSAAAKYLRMQYNERCLGMDMEECLGMDMADGEEPPCVRPINVEQPKPKLFESERMQSRCVRGTLNIMKSLSNWCDKVSKSDLMFSGGSGRNRYNESTETGYL